MTKVYVLELDGWTETWATDGVRGINLYRGDNTADAVEVAYQYKLENENTGDTEGASDTIGAVVREWINNDELLDAVDSLGQISEEVFLKYIALGDE